jgi:flotillin
MPSVIFISLLVLMFMIVLITFLSRYKMCPPDRVLVVYGTVGTGQSSKCYHGGSTFVFPVFQSYGYLELKPINIDVPLRGALSAQNIRVDTPASFTVGVATEPGVMENAATRLLGRSIEEIRSLASEIIMGQMRVVIASMKIEEINADREKLIALISKGVEVELNKVGLKMINVNITDIRDASGYIEALGKEAAARAINDANIKVAEETRRGEIGRAEAERDQAIRVSEARAAAIAGENEAKIRVAQSNAALAVKEAEAHRNAEVAEKVQAAQTLQEAYRAQQEAELARAQREKATQEADILIKAEIEKRRMEIEAEAQAERQRRTQRGQSDAFIIQKEAEGQGLAKVAEGEAQAILTRKRAEGQGVAAVAEGEAQGIRARLVAEGEGTRAVLENKAKGFQQLISSAGGVVTEANQLLITEQLARLYEIQAGAVKGLTFEKIVVMGGGAGGNGQAGVSGFVQDLVKGTLPLHEVAGSLGVRLPGYLGSTTTPGASEAPAPDPKAG